MTRFCPTYFSPLFVRALRQLLLAFFPLNFCRQPRSPFRLGRDVFPQIFGDLGVLRFHACNGANSPSMTSQYNRANKEQL